MNYKKHLKKGFISIFKEILKEICESGIKDTNLTITFSTNNKHVVVSEHVKWGEDEMKIFITEGSFEDLRIHDLFFEVVIYFGDQEELIKVPYIYIKKIEDVEANFELDYSSLESENDFYITDENVINVNFEKNK